MSSYSWICPKPLLPISLVAAEPVVTQFDIDVTTGGAYKVTRLVKHMRK